MQLYDEFVYHKYICINNICHNFYGAFFSLLFCLLFVYSIMLIYTLFSGADPGGGGGGAHPACAPPKIGKNMIFLHKIVIFHIKYPKNCRASLLSAQFFSVLPPLT